MRNMKTGQLLIDQPMEEQSYPYNGSVKVEVRMSLPGFMKGRDLILQGWTSCSYGSSSTCDIENIDWEEFVESCEVTNLTSDEEAQLWEEHYDYVLFKLENELNNSWYYLDGDV